MTIKELCNLIKLQEGVKERVLEFSEGYDFTAVEKQLEDIKKLTEAPSQVLAILEKKTDETTYATVKHVAKGLNLNNVTLPDEINNMISLKNYVYKGKK